MSLMSSYSSAHLYAIFWIVAWAFLFSMAMALAKLLDPSVNPTTLIFSRSLVGVIAAMPLFMKGGFVTHLRTKQLPLHLFRVILVSVAMGCTYYAYRHLPIAYAAAIGQTGPLFTTLMAILFLGERVKWYKWVALGVGYFGVMVMVRPTEAGLELAVPIAFAANILAGAGIIIVKRLTRTDASETILFYATFGVLTISGILSLWLWQTPSHMDMIKLAGIGVAGVLSQYCYIRALKWAQASFITAFEYVRLCMTIPIGYFIFDELPDQWTILGSLIIIVAIIFLTRADREEGAQPYRLT